MRKIITVNGASSELLLRRVLGRGHNVWFVGRCAGYLRRGKWSVICVDAPRWRYWRVVATAGAITTTAFSIMHIYRIWISSRSCNENLQSEFPSRKFEFPSDMLMLISSCANLPHRLYVCSSAVALWACRTAQRVCALLRQQNVRCNQRRARTAKIISVISITIALKSVKIAQNLYVYLIRSLIHMFIYIILYIYLILYS